MREFHGAWQWTAALVLAALATAAPSRDARAHCDTMDGPVVIAARVALDRGDVTPALKWVSREHDGEVRAAFAKVMKVRKQGAEAHALADLWFFETLVRLHREGEGEPYTGLKPAGTRPEPAVRAADDALVQGSADALVELVGGEVARGLRERCARAIERRRHADDSVEAGRAYVAAYVDFVHYTERMWQEAAGGAPEGRAAGGGSRAH